MTVYRMGELILQSFTKEERERRDDEQHIVCTASKPRRCQHVGLDVVVAVRLEDRDAVIFGRRP